MPELVIISKGKEYTCLYDQEDHELISCYKWYLHPQGYAATSIKRKTVLMHRLVLGIVGVPEIEADHKFHNKLDNRKENLRFCNRSENRRNSRKLKGSSIYKGVYKDGKYYHSQILEGNLVKNLGRYYSEKTAAKVYDNEARQLFKDFAFLNFPDFKLANQLSIPGL